MNSQWHKSSPDNSRRGIDIVRVGVALIIFMHPLHGFSHVQNIPRFGEYLSSLGYPFGLALAWSVLITQTLCSLALLANRLVIPACLGHMLVIVFGIIHVHAQYGWYVVGPGQGGMEWGFVLLTCLLGVLWAHSPSKNVIAQAVNLAHKERNRKP